MDHVAISGVLALSDAGVWGPDADHDGVSILRSKNFRADGDISFDNLAIKDIAQKDRIRKLLLPGDILVEKSGGGPKQPVGRVVFFRGSARHHVFGNFIARLRVRPDVCDPRFLFWFLHVGHQRGVTENFQKQTTGIRNLEFKRFLGQKMPLPPLDEQRRIVGLLDRAAEIRRRADAARAKARAIIPALFLDTFGDPATNPKGWPVVELGDVITRITGGKNIEAGNGTSQYRIMKVSAVTSGIFKAHEAKPAPDDHIPAEDHHVRPGDFLFSRANTSELVGAVAIADDVPAGLLLPDKIWRIEWTPARMEPRFAYSLLRSSEIRRIFAVIGSGTSGSMKNISQAKLVRVPIPLPPLPIQTAFAEQTHRLDSLARHLDAAAAKAEAMAAGLSAEVFG
jgi:type I restriction enzyme S subunit